MSKPPRQIIADQLILQTAAAIALARRHNEAWSVVDSLIEQSTEAAFLDVERPSGKARIKSLLDVFEALADVYSRDELRAMARSFHQDSKLKPR